MTKPILIKKSFNGGELSPELHYRDDLAAYAKGCKHLDNMQSTPYGAVTRRPPMELMAQIDTALYGVPVKYIPFKFSLTEVFNIVFTDGSGSESADPSTADFMVFDDDGNLVVLSGVSDFLKSTPYDPADFVDLHFINVNDFVYMTCGGNYPVQIINRFFDIDEGSNRWKISAALFKGGAFLDPNAETGKKLSTSFPEYDVADPYIQGDIVWGVADGLAASGSRRLYGTSTLKSFHCYDVSGISALELEKGDLIFISGLTLSGGSNCFLRGTNTPAVGDVSGEYFLTNIIGSNDLKTSMYLELRPGGSFPTVTWTGELWKASEYGSFYISTEDSTGEPLSDLDFWDEVDRTVTSGTMSSTESMFIGTDVGRFIELSSENEEGTSGDWTENQASVSIIGGSLVELTTSGGAWGGKLTLQESKDSGLTWEDIGAIESQDGSFNGSIERDITEPSSLIRVKLTGYQEADASFSIRACQWSLKTPEGVNEIYEVTGYIDENTVTVTPVTPVARPRSDYRWALGAWSDTSGYPSSLTIHDERLCLGGCTVKPNTVFASRVNEWDNFLRGNLETSPYQFTVASDAFDAIRNLKSSRQLNIFTDNSENTMGSRDDNSITSVSNISVSSHTNYGSSSVQAVQMADMIWFSMGQSRRVRASRYDFASDAQQSVEMSLFASHITESGIKEMSFRRHPFNTLFCVLNNGTAASFTYEGAQEVQAWSPITTAGTIISAYANYSDKGDIVNGIVERNGFYYLEKFGSNDSGTVYLDNFVTYTDQDFTLGVPLEQGYTDNLIVVCDDAVLTEGDDYTIVAGVLTIPTASCTTVTVGIPFTSRVNPTDVTEFGPNGSTRRLSALALYLLNSGDCEVQINGRDSNFTDGSRLVAGERLNGRFEMTTGGGHDAGCDVNLLIANHKPFTLTGLGFRMTVTQ